MNDSITTLANQFNHDDDSFVKNAIFDKSKEIDNFFKVFRSNINSTFMNRIADVKMYE